MPRRTWMIWMLLASLWLALEPEAHADEGEVSLHGLVQLGKARLGIREAPGQTDTGSFVGAGARVTYATRHWYAYEASVLLAQLDHRMRYTVDALGYEETWRWRMSWVRADLGVTGRFGARLIPTLQLALGVQTRVAWQGRSEPGIGIHAEPDQKGRDLSDRMALQLIGTVGAGLDYRLGDQWIAGLAVTGQHALLAEAPFQSIAATFHISYYFYPEGAGP
jgi:hypothetical protein